MMSIEKLREEGIRWVEANRSKRFSGVTKLLTDLYPDNAHFIYELLQNAEDARDKSVPNRSGASVVRFTLNDDALEFEHNGEGLFTLEDVGRITGIGDSAKRDDPTSIGKFGIGFKAVFAYTNTPEIHSGEFHFRIHDLVVPETEGVTRPRMSETETRFIFPFDNPKKPPLQAVAEIVQGLRALGDNTLLFLHNIHKIEYLLPDGSFGSLERIDHDGGHIEIRANHPGGKDTVSHWLRFQKDIEVDDEDGKPKNCRIAIAYSVVEEDDKKKSQPAWKIVPLDHGQVSIYFPAEKETSNLRFHLHAPFASTVARDSVRDCDANRRLRDHIANLLVESLTAIRDRSMLTMGFLAVLPNQMDNLPSFYEPIRHVIVRAFKDEALTPTRSGSYAPAAELYRGPAKIAEVLNDDDLSFLTNGEPPLWAANPPQQNQREDRFLDTLKIDRWGWSELASSLSCIDDDERKPIENWISQKDDSWLMRLYALLGEAYDVHNECVDAEGFRIVRVETGQADEHVFPQEAFFPPEQETTPPRDILFVKFTVYNTGRNEAQKKFAVSFLEHIGVRPFDAKAVIELRLGHHDNPPDQAGDGHYKDLKQFIAYWKKNPADADLFKKHTFLLGTSEDGTLDCHRPAQLCIDVPYLSTGLAELTSIHKKNVLWPAYKYKLNESQFTDFISFLQAVGVMHGLNVSRASLHSNPNVKDLWKGLYGTRSTYTGISEDYSINALDSYTKLQSVSASRLVWHALIRAESRSAKARYRPNQQYQTREVDSQLVLHLKTCAWIPDKSDIFRRPQDMTRDGLRTDFPYDDRNGLLTAIGFGENEIKQTAEYKQDVIILSKYNLTPEIAEELRQLSCDEQQELLANIRQKRESSNHSQMEPLPTSPAPNPQRRFEKGIEQAEEAEEKTYEVCQRSVRVTSPPGVKEYLLGKNINENGNVICQICNGKMPFKINGKDYFEGVQCISDIKREVPANYLALCPNCAAEYKHGNSTKDDDISESILNLKSNASIDLLTIPLEMPVHCSLRFTQKHLIDLQAILNAFLIGERADYSNSGIFDTESGPLDNEDLAVDAAPMPCPETQSVIPITNQGEERHYINGRELIVARHPRLGNSVKKCPYCACEVSEGKFQKHISKKCPKRPTKSSLQTLQTNKTISWHPRCRFCDGFAMPGSDVCYSCG